MDNLTLFPVSDVTMYKYYIGRLKMFEDRYEDARECLRFALRFCPAHCIKNKQRILASLVPVEVRERAQLTLNFLIVDACRCVWE